VEVLAGYLFPTESPTDSKRQPIQCDEGDDNSIDDEEEENSD
jgi:hypothetical protein